MKVRTSQLLRVAWKRQCEYDDAERLNLILDVRTRWDSTYDMINRALKMRRVIDSMAVHEAGLKVCIITLLLMLFIFIRDTDCRKMTGMSSLMYIRHWRLLRLGLLS